MVVRMIPLLFICLIVVSQAATGSVEPSCRSRCGLKEFDAKLAALQTRYDGDISKILNEIVFLRGESVSKSKAITVLEGELRAAASTSKAKLAALKTETGIQITGLKSEFDQKIQSLKTFQASKVSVLTNENAALRTDVDTLKKDLLDIKTDLVAKGKVIDQNRQDLDVKGKQIEEMIKKSSADRVTINTLTKDLKTRSSDIQSTKNELRNLKNTATAAIRTMEQDIKKAATNLAAIGRTVEKLTKATTNDDLQRVIGKQQQIVSDLVNIKWKQNKSEINMKEVQAKLEVLMGRVLHGFRKKADGAYYRVFTKANFNDAKKTCQKHGAYLAIDDSSASNNVLQALIPKGEKYGMWVGATDEKKEGTWVWVDGRKVTTDHWGQREPSSGKSENCMMLYVKFKGFKWNDTPCKDKLPFTCQIRV